VAPLPLTWDFQFEMPEPFLWDLKMDQEFRLRADELRARLDEMRYLELPKLDLGLLPGEIEAKVQKELEGRQFELDMAETLRAKELAKIELKNFDTPFIWPGSREFPQPDWPRPQQGTPEDSLYRSAREALNRGEYGRAASQFQSLEQRFPKSRFAPTALYYQSFALYRSGSTENLRTALEVLRARQEKFPETVADPVAGALRTRVYAALAARGDASAAAALRAATSTGPSCDEEDMEVRSEALSALTQLDPENASAALKRVLARRDECSVELRRRAVYLLGRSGTEQSVNDLLDAAKSDPDSKVRSDAISQLGRSSVASVNSQMLLQIFHAAEEERTRQAVLSALRSKGGPESRAALRSIIERSDLPERLRAQAISQLAGYRYVYVGQTPAPPVAVRPGAVREAVVAVSPEPGRTEQVLEDEDAAFLRTLYPKTDSRTIKSAIISVISRTGGAQNDQWLMGIVRNGNEDSSLRGEALSRMKSLSIDDLGRLYESLTERQFRSAVVSQLASRDEPAATEKLIDIAKTSTDPSIRNRAVQALTRRAKEGKDAKAMAFIRELVEKP
jgi:HEAT repeat protein